MSGLTDDEANQLLEPGLQVDPNEIGNSMQVVDKGAAGKVDVTETPELIAAREEFGAEIVDAAYKHGWRPKGEHKGNPDNWVDPLGFFDRYAETANKRAKREANAEAEKRIAGIAKTVEKKVDSLGKRLDKVDAADREATKRQYNDLIAEAQGDPEKIEKIMKDRDEALAEIDSAGTAADEPAVDDATIRFFEKHPALQNPQTTDDYANQAWARARAGELEAKYPKASLEQVFNQISYELDQKATKASGATNVNENANRGRTLSDENGLPANSGGNSDDVTIATMSADQKSAFQKFVKMNVYADTQEGMQQYVDGLNDTLREEAMKANA